jgi:type IV pilus assembly protein PilV
MIEKRTARRASPVRQDGSFMLEALIAILIVSLGILGTVGLFARSMQTFQDSGYRGEAALLANTLVGRMWVSDPKFASLSAKFDSGSGGAEYTEFAALVAQRLPNSLPPVVTVTPGTTATSSDVVITIQWRHPGDDPLDPVLPGLRRYVANATIGANL